MNMRRLLLPLLLTAATAGAQTVPIDVEIGYRWLELKGDNGMYRTQVDEQSGLHNFLEIVTKPDNIPIVGMLILVIFFTWLGLREAFRNDKLIEEGKEDEIPNEMWK